MIVRQLGKCDYHQGGIEQDEARTRVLAGGDDELLLVEHNAVVTLGRRGGQWDAARLAQLQTEVVQTDRGGLATWHGPGQVVGYPIVNLKRAGWSVPAFVAAIGDMLLRLVHGYGLQGALYDPERPGIYIDGRKLASIGLHIHRGVSSHGFALNVSCELSGFQAIVPCGFSGLAVSNLQQELKRPFDVQSVFQQIEKRVPQLLSSSPEGEKPYGDPPQVPHKACSPS